MTETQATKRRLRWLFLLALIILLIAANLLYPVVAGWQGTLAGEAGALLYAAGFDGFSDEWQQYKGRASAQTVDGVLRISVNSSATIYSAAAPIFGDFDARVTTRVLAGDLANEGYGMVFRLQEERSGCNRAFVLACGLTDLPVIGIPVQMLFANEHQTATGYHVFLISNDGYYSIWSSNEENLLEKVTVWHDSAGLIHTGMDVENTLRVVGRGDEFRFFINGEAVELCIPLAGQQPTGNSVNCLGERSMVWRNDTLDRGRLGLVVNVNQLPGTVVEFDNLTVFSPEDELQASDQL